MKYRKIKSNQKNKYWCSQKTLLITFERKAELLNSPNHNQTKHITFEPLNANLDFGLL